MSPHRLMPYPKAILTDFHKRQNLTDITTSSPFAWSDMNCCLERQNCGNRKSWLSVKDSRVPVLNIYGLYVPLGNANFFEETYRTCNLNEYGDWAYCP